ncbi:MAG: 50S ribosomal protein L11 methyltransferase [Acidobacteriota bacterium]|nr:50S ribosomal protein L11 methyltransferase [Acidobacteriota bacterium]
MRNYPAIEIRQAGGAMPLSETAAALVDDFQPTAIEETTDIGVIRVFFVDQASREAAMDAVRAGLPGASVRALDVPDEDWAARSQASLKAVRVGAMVVAPPWDIPAGDAASTIVILPSTGFGTGHHATTRLCLAALQQVEPAGKSIIDVGTGSGVLAIAAARLGATRAIGIDSDQDAIDNALDNRALNAAPGVEFLRAGLEDAADEGPFDVVLANLTGGMLMRFAAPLMAFAADGGRLILSGLREEEEAGVMAAFNVPLVARDTEDGWVCLVIRKGP